MHPRALLSYFAVASLPLAVLALGALVRWRYLSMIRRRAHASAAAAPPPATLAPAGGPVAGPLDVRFSAPVVTEAATAARREARAGERAMRGAFACALGVYFAAAAGLVYVGGRPGLSPRQAAWVAYVFTAPLVVLLPTFLRARFRAWIAAPVAWLAVQLALFGSAVEGSWLDVAGLLASSASTGAFLVAFVAPLALRVTRPLLVLTAPITTLFFALSVAAALLFPITAESVEKVPLRPALLVGAVVGSGSGIALAVWAIRRSSVARGAGIAAAAAAIGWLGILVPGRPLALAVVASIGSHALASLGAWALFRRFLALKWRGFFPDEVLHLVFCCAMLTPFIAFAVGGRPRALAALIPLTSAVVVLYALLRRQQRVDAGRPPRRMLLLRVFGRGRQGGRLLDLLDDTWRRVGRVDLVVGDDVALRTMSARALEHFLLGRAHQQYVRIASEALQRVQALPGARELDGRHPLNEIHCLPDMWQPVVSLLARQADVVLLDLRGLSAANAGALFELRLVVQQVPLERVVVLADQRTDEALLARTAQEAWTALPAASPNRDGHDTCLEIVRCGRWRRQDEDAIATTVFAAAFPGRAA
jgi:hypothetical protein